MLIQLEATPLFYRSYIRRPTTFGHGHQIVVFTSVPVCISRNRSFPRPRDQFTLTNETSSPYQIPSKSITANEEKQICVRDVLQTTCQNDQSWCRATIWNKFAYNIRGYRPSFLAIDSCTWIFFRSHEHIRPRLRALSTQI